MDAKLKARVRAGDVMSRTVMNVDVTVTGVSRFRWRVWFGKQLLMLAARVMGSQCKINVTMEVLDEDKSAGTRRPE